jgi:formamidopyrimidine-DNA glycosylase
MPELPEVETVARGLRAFLVGSTVVGVEVRWARSVIPPDPTVFAAGLIGQTVTGVGRRGKWIIVSLSEAGALLVHLRMTGRLVVEPGDASDDPHTRVLVQLNGGRRLRFSDQRKFGRLVLTSDPHTVLADLGPEPLADNFTAARLEEMLAHRRGRIKPLLLNQRFLAGLGNIYADEALFRARLHPLRGADTLTPVEVRRLFRAIRSLLQAAIGSGGTTLADAAYQQPDGSSGEYADLLAVYGRTGQPCQRCTTAIERIVVGQRSSHYCPRCQTLPDHSSEPRLQGEDREPQMR